MCLTSRDGIEDTSFLGEYPSGYNVLGNISAAPTPFEISQHTGINGPVSSRGTLIT